MHNIRKILKFREKKRERGVERKGRVKREKEKGRERKYARLEIYSNLSDMLFRDILLRSEELFVGFIEFLRDK